LYDAGLLPRIIPCLAGRCAAWFSTWACCAGFASV